MEKSFRIYLDGNRFFRAYTSYKRAEKCCIKLASDNSVLVELWLYGDGSANYESRTLLRYWN